MTRLTRRFQRRALIRPNLPYYVWRFVGNGARTFRALTTSASFSDTPAVARELLDQGIVVGPSDRFLSDQGRVALASSARKMLDRSRGEDIQAILAGTSSPDDRKKDFLVNLFPSQGGTHSSSPLLKLALDRKLLEIVSLYLGVWPCLHSIAVWLNYATEDPPEASQLWHRDPEDLKVIKVFIYLADVDEQHGPFTYIPKTHPFGAQAVRADACRTKRVDDARMHRFFPPTQWRVCTGPANTMILADTVGFHRGGKPTSGTRLLITFTYTSATPFVARPLGVKGHPAWLSSAIQRYAIAPAVRSDHAPTHKSSPGSP
ncbi:MAG: hypothetical protein HY824_15900 [Acidobacteria bacterium]|nr:hypothetical protein [Acidobacteriota bacterium]